jgi:hypothetical protein
MPTLDLGAKYGRGNSRALINRAIRAELVGGDQCLTALDALAELRRKWRERGWTDGLVEIEEALRRVDRLYATMRAEIRRRYDMPPE